MRRKGFQAVNERKDKGNEIQVAKKGRKIKTRAEIEPPMH